MYDCLYQLRDFGVFKGYTERVRKQKKEKKIPVFTVFLYSKVWEMFIKILNFQIFGGHIAVAVNQYKKKSFFELLQRGSWLLFREANTFATFIHVK